MHLFLKISTNIHKNNKLRTITSTEHSWKFIVVLLVKKILFPCTWKLITKNCKPTVEPLLRYFSSIITSYTIYKIFHWYNPISTSRTPKWSVLFRHSDSNFVCISHFSMHAMSLSKVKIHCKTTSVLVFTL